MTGSGWGALAPCGTEEGVLSPDLLVFPKQSKTSEFWGITYPRF